MEKPMVSIICPVYNSERLIEETINSVISQTYKNYELLVCDDGSTDNTLMILESCFKDHKNIRIYSNSCNQGIVFTRNFLINISKGRYIAFLDSDDYWEKNKLESQLEHMKLNKSVFSCTNYSRYNQDLTVRKKVVKPPATYKYKDLLKYNFIGNSTVILDSDYFVDIEIPDIKKRNDYALWLKLLETGVVGTGLDESLVKYRVRKGSASSDKLGLIKYQFELFHKVRGYSYLRSCFLVLRNVFYKVLK